VTQTATPLPTRHWTPAQAAEVLDALARRQREIPSWVLAECPAAPERALAGVERALVESRLAALLDDGRRAVVALDDVRPTARVAVPAALPRPRLFVMRDNAMGAFGAVGAVRVLRAVRAAMDPHDLLLLALDVSDDRSAIEDEGYDAAGALAARHLAVLGVLNRELGADFDAHRFAYRVTYEPEPRRAETHLVATAATRVTVPGHGVLAIGRGESLRTAIDCKYERARVEAMLAGVGLTLDDWTTDPRRRVALATASPAR
jgi:L-histidine N-alpha-methyltransferase